MLFIARYSLMKNSLTNIHSSIIQTLKRWESIKGPCREARMQPKGSVGGFLWDLKPKGSIWKHRLWHHVIWSQSPIQKISTLQPELEGWSDLCVWYTTMCDDSHWLKAAHSTEARKQRENAGLPCFLLFKMLIPSKASAQEMLLPTFWIGLHL